MRPHFASVMTWNNHEMIAETWNSIFRWRSPCRRYRLCLSSLIISLPFSGGRQGSDWGSQNQVIHSSTVLSPSWNRENFLCLTEIFRVMIIRAVIFHLNLKFADLVSWPWKMNAQISLQLHVVIRGATLFANGMSAANCCCTDHKHLNK